MNGDDSGEQDTPPDEENKVEDANVDVRQGSLKYDELEVNGKINIGGETGQGSLQSQGTPFCWERFLHIRTIKVLLVEYDDSTRHVVAALLRKCNYEVIEASNGLQAWKVLEDLTNHVDLILSEVVTPCVSGVGLLCKIMSHKSHKNIPIIMMSSHDSMGLVFKCLTKGAVDFLVKPIRKNELKNLWQHVWRRCHSSSGSGSETGSVSQNQKSTKSKGDEKSENHSGRNDKEDGKSNGMNIGYRSDDGSGAQSSWTKQPTEVDSSQETSPIDETSEFEDSTCAQVRYSNAEAAAINQFQATSAGNCLQLLQPELRGLVACKAVKIEVKPDAIDFASNHISAQKSAPLEIEPSIVGYMKHKSLECPKVDYRTNDHQVVCSTTSGPDVEVNRSGSFLENADRQDEMNDTPKNSGKPNVELSLKHLRGVREAGKDVQDDCNILSHSELSAFSRYNASTAFRAPHGIDITGSSSVIDKSLDGGKKELEFDMHFHSNDTCPYPSSKRGSNTSDISSTTNKLLPSPLIVPTEAPSLINGLHTSSTLKPVKDSVQCSTQQVNVVNQSDVQSSTLFAPAGESHQQLPILQPHHHHHHHYHINHFHNFESDQQMSNNQELSQRKLAADASLCGKPNVPGGPGEATPLDYSLEQSASGSNYGSNGHNGSSNAVNASGTNGESDTGINLKSGTANSRGSGNRLDQKNILPQREATLARFGQKRKERRFDKQVRYKSRKRLEEIRPHVRGLFERQIEQDDSSSYEADEM